MVCRICVIFLVCGVLLGCGTSQPVVVDYDDHRNRTIYRTKSIPVRVETRGADYASRFRRLNMRLRADCVGRECQPDRVRLMLSVSSGPSDLHIGERDFTLIADGERFIWEDRIYEQRNRPEHTVGMILEVMIGVDRLQKVANAEKVEAYVGSRGLNISRRNQERLRTFLTEMGYGKDPA